MAAKTSLRTEDLHPKSMSVYDSYALVQPAGAGAKSFNYQQYVTVTPRGTWIVCWTQGTTEATPDQRVVCRRSEDHGKTWSDEIVIEEASPVYKVPAWVMPFTVPHTGRVYMFYWYNCNDDDVRDGGDIFYRHSDDDGRSWSKRYRTGVPRTELDDEGFDIHGWNFGPFVLMPSGKPMMNYNKIRRSTMLEGLPDKWETEVFFMECENILQETDPGKLIFRFYPEGGRGLHAKHPVYGQNFGQEATLLPLSGGKIVTIFRTRTGYLYYSASRDGAKSWSEPEPLRFCPHGPLFRQPCASPPAKKLRDGRIVLLYHNTEADQATTKSGNVGWTPRHPLWIAVGRELTGTDENGGLIFGSPRVLLYNDGIPGGSFDSTEIAYPEIFEWGGKVFVSYSSKTEEIRISEIDPALLDDFGLPV